MVDPVTTVAAGLAVLGSKELLVKLLGPTADYVGGELRDFAQKCNINLDNVFRAAFRKLGPRLDLDGTVSPRVLKHVVDEARFCDDPLTAEYLGGVLASSRTDVSRDDRGMFYISEINSLSTYQLRTHFLLYASVVRSEKPYKQDLSHWFKDDSITVVIPDSGYVEGMAFSADESVEQIASHSFLGLQMHGLSKRGMDVISHEKQGSEFDTPFRFFHPTRFGFELFLWGLGLGNLKVSSFFDLDRNISLPIEPPFCPLSIKLGQISYS